jgi:hypothetical protein
LLVFIADLLARRRRELAGATRVQPGPAIIKSCAVRQRPSGRGGGADQSAFSKGACAGRREKPPARAGAGVAWRVNRIDTPCQDGRHGRNRRSARYSTPPVPIHFFSILWLELDDTMRREVSSMNDNEWLRKTLAEQKKKQAENLVRAKAKAKETGKEPFDFEKFCSLYDPMPDMAPTDAAWPLDIRERWEMKYYLHYPDVMTIEEFVKRRIILDVYNS